MNLTYTEILVDEKSCKKLCNKALFKIAPLKFCVVQVINECLNTCSNHNVNAYRPVLFHTR